MGARRPAFALMLVLAASAMVFALAIFGAVAIRSATIEASSMHDRGALTRDARSAIALVLAGLTAASGDADDPLVTSASQDGAAGGDEPSSVDDLELPPFPSGMPFNLGSSGDDNGASGAGAAGTGSGATRQTKPRGAFSALRALGLPTAPVTIEINGAEYVVRVEDALGGVDINRADEQRLIDYFRLVGLSRGTSVAIAQQIVDWRDADDFRRPHGAEREDYRRRDIRIRNAPFETVDELRFLPSMTGEIYDLVRDDLCVGSDGRTYVGASHAALAAVPGISGSAVRAIEARQRAGGVMSAAELGDLLGLANDAAGPNLRTTPSDRLRVIVEPLARPGVRIVGEASVTDRRGVRIGAVALR